MTEATKTKGAEPMLDEIIDYAITYLDYPQDVIFSNGMDSADCEMEPEAFELACATIAYVAYRLLLMDRMRKDASSYEANWVAVRRHEDGVRKEVGSVLGVDVEEIRQLYKTASKTCDEDEAYRDSVNGIIEDFADRYDLDTRSLGIVFV